MTMHVIYFLFLVLVVPILAAIPIYLIFVGGPFLVIYTLNLVWRIGKRILFPTSIIPLIPVTPLPPTPPMKPYKPRGRKSKMTGIRANRAILYIAKGGNK